MGQVKIRLHDMFFRSEERNLKIAKHLGLSENQIKNWFENRRKKARLDSKQLQQRHHS